MRASRVTILTPTRIGPSACGFHIHARARTHIHAGRTHSFISSDCVRVKRRRAGVGVITCSRIRTFALSLLASMARYFARYSVRRARRDFTASFSARACLWEILEQRVYERIMSSPRLPSSAATRKRFPTRASRNVRATCEHVGEIL